MTIYYPPFLWRHVNFEYDFSIWFLSHWNFEVYKLALILKKLRTIVLCSKQTTRNRNIIFPAIRNHLLVFGSFTPDLDNQSLKFWILSSLVLICCNVCTVSLEISNKTCAKFNALHKKKQKFSYYTVFELYCTIFATSA